MTHNILKQLSDLQAENTQLTDRIHTLEAALEFYADKFTWRSNSGKIGTQPIYYGVDKGGDCELIDGQFTAGYRARAALNAAFGKDVRG